MISYRSANEWAQRFGRKKSSKNNITQNTFGIENTGFEFEIESYLEHLAVKFQDVFDANCYLYLSRSIDWFDIIDYGSSSEEVLGKTELESALILGVESDILFPIDQQKELAEYLATNSTKVTYKSLDCVQGHDSLINSITGRAEALAAVWRRPHRGFGGRLLTHARSQGWLPHKNHN